MSFTLDLRKNKSPAPQAPAIEVPSEPNLNPKNDSVEPAPQVHQVLSWEADVKETFSRRRAVISGIVLFIVAGLEMFFWRDYLFGIVLVIGGLSIIVSTYHQAEKITITLNRTSISFGGQKYMLNQLKSFWLAYNPPRNKELILVQQKALTPTVRLPLGDANPLEIRKIMVSLVPEEEYQDSLLDHLVRRLSR